MKYLISFTILSAGVIGHPYEAVEISKVAEVPREQYLAQLHGANVRELNYEKLNHYQQALFGSKNDFERALERAKLNTVTEFEGKERGELDILVRNTNSFDDLSTEQKAKFDNNPNKFDAFKVNLAINDDISKMTTIKGKSYEGLTEDQKLIFSSKEEYEQLPKDEAFNDALKRAYLDKIKNAKDFNDLTKEQQGIFGNQEIFQTHQSYYKFLDKIESDAEKSKKLGLDTEQLNNLINGRIEILKRLGLNDDESLEKPDKEKLLAEPPLIENEKNLKKISAEIGIIIPEGQVGYAKLKTILEQSKKKVEEMNHYISETYGTLKNEQERKIEAIAEELARNMQTAANANARKRAGLSSLHRGVQRMRENFNGLSPASKLAIAATVATALGLSIAAIVEVKKNNERTSEILDQNAQILDSINALNAGVNNPNNGLVGFNNNGF